MQREGPERLPILLVMLLFVSSGSAIIHMSIRMPNSRVCFVICWLSEILKVLQAMYWHCASWFVQLVSETKQRQLCLSNVEVIDRRAAPLAPTDIPPPLLSVWCTSRGLASYFSGKTSNINGVL